MLCCVRVCMSDGSDNGQTTTWVTLIALGGAVCIAIIVVIGVLLQRTISYRKQATELNLRQRYLHQTLQERSQIKRAIKLKTSPARLAQLLQPSLAFCFSLQPMAAHRPGLDGTPTPSLAAS